MKQIFASVVKFDAVTTTTTITIIIIQYSIELCTLGVNHVALHSDYKGANVLTNNPITHNMFGYTVSYQFMAPYPYAARPEETDRARLDWVINTARVHDIHIQESQDVQSVCNG